jgi:CheY-like chemotaxis protein
MSKVLVIDDDRDFLDAVRAMLEKAQYDVDVAATPDAGIEKVRASKPDLVVLDVMMPSNYEGFAVARTIREELQLRSLPIIILSVINGRKEVPYRFAANDDYLPVDAFLDKPLDAAHLVDAVQQLLGQQRAEPEYPL